MAASKGLSWPSYAKGDAMFKSYPAQAMAVQYLLRNRGFHNRKIDGVFGDETVKAVRRFQRAKRLKDDGVIGPQTWPVLLLRLEKGDRGDAVRALQVLLRSFTDHDGGKPLRALKVDGVFGDSTEKAVRLYQRGTSEADLKVDGIAGTLTWNALL